MQLTETIHLVSFSFQASDKMFEYLSFLCYIGKYIFTPFDKLLSIHICLEKKYASIKIIGIRHTTSLGCFLHVKELTSYGP